MKRIFLISALAVVVIAAIVLLMKTTTSLTKSNAPEEGANSTASQWTIISTAAGRAFRDCRFLDETHGWALTEHSAWKTEDAGQIWEEIRTAPNVSVLKNYEPQADMKKVEVLSLSDVWVLEGSSLIHTVDGGLSWQKSEIKNVIVRSFGFLDSANGWAVGQLLRLPAKKGEVESWHPVIYGTTDGGRNWRSQFVASENHYPLWDVWINSLTDIWAAGALILHSSDAGNTWKEVLIEDRGGAGGMPSEIQFFDSNVGWMKTSETGAYLLTSNGGKTWKALELPPEINGSFADLLYVSSEDLWGAAGSIYHSSDAGRTWLKALSGDYGRLQYSKRYNTIFAIGKGIARHRIQ